MEAAPGNDAAAAAIACMDVIAAVPAAAPASPQSMAHSIADALAAPGAPAWVVRADTGGAGLASAWILRYLAPAQRAERPLLYLMESDSRAGLASAFLETTGRGVFLNAAPPFSRWPNGVKPDVPLWLADDETCIPYDPATTGEVRAIVRSALQALYVDGDATCYYLNLHAEEPSCLDADPENLSEAYTGMYLLGRTGGDAVHTVSLLGAGRTLARVERAAQLLWEQWGIGSEVWSCPSYTKLAREARRAQRWNTLHPTQPRRTSRLARCLWDGRRPVIAATAYGRHVAAQVGAHLEAPFHALGAESPDAGWMVVLALQALAGQGRLPPAQVAAALRQYGYDG